MLKITFTVLFFLIGLNTGLSSPRPLLPVDWNGSNYETKDLTCGQTYSLVKEGFIKFTLNSEENSCYYGFLGSRNLHCTVAILCSGTIDFAPATGDLCKIEFLSLSDGTLGHMGGCDSFSFKNTPRIPRNNGSDVHVTYKGKSVDSSCVAFCKQDLNEEHATAGIKTPKRLRRNKYFTGFKTLPSCTCGIRRIGGKIVGGEDALKYEFPWLGFLVEKDENITNSREAYCGASLISDSHAITAAHCIFHTYQDEPADGPDMQLILYAHVADRSLRENDTEDESYTSIPGWTRYKFFPENDTTENSVRLDIEDIIIHPFYKHGKMFKFDYDVAILKLKQKVNLHDGRALPICLPFLNESVTYKDGDKMTVAGWGLLNYKAPAGSIILQKLELPYVPSDTCVNTMPGLTPRQICAGYIEGGKDSCSGDSGGPLIFDKFISDKNQNILAGIVSSGARCAKKNALGIYSDVQVTDCTSWFIISELLGWINYHLAKDDAYFCKR